MKYFDRFDKPISNDPNELKKSFEYLKESLQMEDKKALSLIRKGFNPAGNFMLLKMTSYMAKVLKENSSKKEFNKYFQEGGISFFADYINWYQKTPSHPDELKFDKDFEQKVNKWNKDWSKSWNKYTRNLVITKSTDLDVVGKRLEKSFADSSVLPNYINQIDNLIVHSVTNGKIAKAFQASSLGVKLYPNSESMNGMYGLLNLLSGNKNKAESFLNKSYKINPNGFTSARNLNDIAYQLASIKQEQAGLIVLQTALKFHPKEANLYDSVGEFYLNLKQKEKALEFYSKAIEVNPNYPNAKNAKNIIDKLKANK